MSETPKLKRPLNPDQEKFCQLFTTPDMEFYGNGAQSYMEAYKSKKSRKGEKWNNKPVSYLAAKANAYRLLTRPEIIARVNELLEAKGFNDENVDKQHLFLINQFADLKSKLGAVEAYNKLKKRVEPNKTLILAGNQITFANYGSEIRPTGE